MPNEDEIVIDFTKYVPNARGFEDGDDDCQHGVIAEWDGEDDTRELDVCGNCGATRTKMWK